MNTRFFSSRLAAVAAGALLTVGFASGCASTVHHPPGVVDTSKDRTGTVHHPPGGVDTSKDGPVRRHHLRRHRHHHLHEMPPPVGAPPAPITHPGG